jgi:hypothetical protein
LIHLRGYRTTHRRRESCAQLVLEIATLAWRECELADWRRLSAREVVGSCELISRGPHRHQRTVRPAETRFAGQRHERFLGLEA